MSQQTRDQLEFLKKLQVLSEYNHTSIEKFRQLLEFKKGLTCNLKMLALCQYYSRGMPFFLSILSISSIMLVSLLCGCFRMCKSWDYFKNVYLYSSVFLKFTITLGSLWFVALIIILSLHIAASVTEQDRNNFFDANLVEFFCDRSCLEHNIGNELYGGVFVYLLILFTLGLSCLICSIIFATTIESNLDVKDILICVSLMIVALALIGVGLGLMISNNKKCDAMMNSEFIIYNFCSSLQNIFVVFSEDTLQNDLPPPYSEACQNFSNPYHRRSVITPTAPAENVLNNYYSGLNPN